MKNLPLMIARSKPNFLVFLSGMGVGLVVLVLIGIYSSNQNSGMNSRRVLPGQDPGVTNRITDFKIPSILQFAGERVPIENFEVRERIDREILVNAYWYSATILALKRANRYFPIIEPILQKYKVPDDFKYIAVIESNLYNSVSPANAVGFWQLTEEVARKYGLDVNEEIDERYNVEKSTEAACKYFLDAYGNFRSWTLAAAAYNMGNNGLAKQIERQIYVKNYYNLLLSDETSRYIARVITIKEIIMHPETYNYYISKDELYPPLLTTNVEVSTPVSNWTYFAYKHGINYKILKYYNPWLRDIALVYKMKKTYEIKIPVKGSYEPIKDE
jgi:hypothetical protein